MSSTNPCASPIGNDSVEANSKREKDFSKGEESVGSMSVDEGSKRLRVRDRIDDVENVGVCKTIRLEGRRSEWMEGEVWLGR